MSRALKIAMVAACPFPYPRGTPIRAYRMAEALTRRGHRVHVVTYHLGEGGEQAPFPIHRIPEVRTYRKVTPGPTYQKLLVLDPLLALKLRGLLAGDGFDVIHAHHYESLLAALAARGRKRLSLVFDAHTMLESELPHYGLGLSRRMKQWIGAQLDRRLPGRADHVIAVTEGIHRKMVQRSGLPEQRVSIIPGGVELEHFEADPPGLSAIPGQTPILVFAGNLASYQGIDLLLRVFHQVRQSRPQARLKVITTSSFAPYRALAQSLDVQSGIEVLNTPFEELPLQLARADVALNPRLDADGYPQKLLNYMAAGKPIVSFEGSAKNLLHGETGWIVADNDVPSFAAGVLRLLEDPALARRLGENARARVRAEFTWEHIAEKTEAVYRRLVGREPAP